MKFSIWGAGVRGRRIKDVLKDHEIVCFIDQDEKKEGTFVDEVPVMCYQSYRKQKEKTLIIVSLWDFKSLHNVCDELDKAGENYLIFEDGPDEFVHAKADISSLVDEAVEQYDIGKYRTIYLLGSSFYTLILYDYLSKYFCCKLHTKGWKSNNIEYLNSEYVFADINDVVDNDYCILYTSRKAYYDRQELSEKKEYPFFSFAKLGRYENKCLSELILSDEDVKRCFICANGPSLSLDDLDKLHRNREISFGMNRVYMAFDKVSWRPDYYVIDDGLVLETDALDYLSLQVKYKLFSDISKIFWRDNKEKISRAGNIYKFHATVDTFFDCKPEFSDDIIHGVYCTSSVLNSCLQLACAMGYREIYIIGADCSMSSDGENNHFIEGYYGERHNHIPNAFLNGFDMAFIGYRRAKEYADEHGIKIYNATRGGKLEIFERVNFDDLF